METEQTTRTPSALRLRVGVALILLWWVPIWLLAPVITERLSNGTGSPLVATVTAVIVVVQTLIGLLGLLVAGAQVKAIVKGRSKRSALAAVWHIFLRGKLEESPAAPAQPATEPPAQPSAEPPAQP